VQRVMYAATVPAGSRELEGDRPADQGDDGPLGVGRDDCGRYLPSHTKRRHHAIQPWRQRRQGASWTAPTRLSTGAQAFLPLRLHDSRRAPSRPEPYVIDVRIEVFVYDMS